MDESLDDKQLSQSGGVALSVRAPNSNRKVDSSMTTLGITRSCVLWKDAKLATVELSG